MDFFLRTYMYNKPLFYSTNVSIKYSMCMSNYSYPFYDEKKKEKEEKKKGIKLVVCIWSFVFETRFAW